MPFAGIILILAVFLDRAVGDPHTPYHPVALLGRFIGWWGRPTAYRRSLQRVAGLIFWIATAAIAVIPALLLEWYAPWWLYILIAPVFLKSTFAWRSLEEHAISVEEGLSRGSGEGQRAAGMMVSRKTALLSDEEVRSAAYESVAENLVDSIIAPLFWFALLGLPGAAMYRAANTMDAMLGYRDDRERLGWFSARADDILSYIPARITGCLLLLWFTARRRGREAYLVLRRDAGKRPGFNGGIPMALIAGGCGIRFEKPGSYRIGDCTQSLKTGGRCVIAAVRGATVLGLLAAILCLHLANQNHLLFIL
ncbi:cobalamin biosynthesis protein CobD [Methanocalculus chunghsingensis]|uniref:Probable cobalamin biosynthesis protein CobD n=1 Tax=Methanocalculus chunghsingensis TaxID=156457 RepID=A0A8J7WA25_9EURY|nr:adenosylcobinamide-phosphate synthase CbiB [Methanocalculus chunghsingensis]MBR1369095.1 cobalamin biosynthesis protein CobD [Methanocalculus chunghsingensis]